MLNRIKLNLTHFNAQDATNLFMIDWPEATLIDLGI